MGVNEKGSGAPAAGSALPEWDTAAKMVALLQVVVDSMHKLEYLEAQKAKALEEEFAAEAAKAEQRKAERRRHERLQIAALALQGLCSSTDEDGRPLTGSHQIAATAVEYADALIAALDAAPAAPKEPQP